MRIILENTDSKNRKLFKSNAIFISHLRLWLDDLFDKRLQCVLCGDDNGTQYWTGEMDRVRNMIKREVTK